MNTLLLFRPFSRLSGEIGKVNYPRLGAAATVGCRIETLHDTMVCLVEFGWLVMRLSRRWQDIYLDLLQ